MFESCHFLCFGRCQLARAAHVLARTSSCFSCFVQEVLLIPPQLLQLRPGSAQLRLLPLSCRAQLQQLFVCRKRSAAPLQLRYAAATPTGVGGGAVSMEVLYFLTSIYFPDADASLRVEYFVSVYVVFLFVCLERLLPARPISCSYCIVWIVYYLLPFCAHSLPVYPDSHIVRSIYVDS